MLNYDSGEEYGSTKEGNKTGRRVVSEEDFMLNARLLINKTYYRHNMYSESSWTHCSWHFVCELFVSLLVWVLYCDFFSSLLLFLLVRLITIRNCLVTHRYVASAHYVEARDQELYIPMIFLTAIATCTALAIASPLAELHPQKVSFTLEDWNVSLSCDYIVEGGILRHRIFQIYTLQLFKEQERCVSDTLFFRLLLVVFYTAAQNILPLLVPSS